MRVQHFVLLLSEAGSIPSFLMCANRPELSITYRASGGASVGWSDRIVRTRCQAGVVQLTQETDPSVDEALSTDRGSNVTAGRGTLSGRPVPLR